jgi:hypothetical protein
MKQEVFEWIENNFCVIAIKIQMLIADGYNIEHISHSCYKSVHETFYNCIVIARKIDNIIKE